MRRDGYQCQEAKRYGKTEPANTVHHIYPVEEYPELSLVDWNLISVSEATHNQLHDRMTGELTPMGQQWQDRRRRQFDEFYGVEVEQPVEQPVVVQEAPIKTNRVVIVWGAPGSGKTTHVRDHMQDGDLVIDLDFIKQAISMQGKTEASDHLLRVALSIREHIYELVECREIPEGITVWVVAGLPVKQQRMDLKRRLDADEVIHIDTPKAECIRRALADPERLDKQLQVEIIERWFERQTL